MSQQINAHSLSIIGRSQCPAAARECIWPNIGYMPTRLLYRGHLQKYHNQLFINHFDVATLGVISQTGTFKGTIVI
jgi:hypothetical protein